jgi:hypothetical protein
MVTLERGELLFGGEREEAGRYGIHRNNLRALLEYLEAHQLMAWPEGRGHRRPVRLLLVDYWPDRLRVDDAGATPVDGNEGPLDVPQEGPSGGPENSAPALDVSQVSGPEKDRRRDRKRDHSYSNSKNSKDSKNTVEDVPPSAGGAPAGSDLREDHPEHPTHRLMRLLVDLGYSGWQLTGSLYAEQAAVVRRLHKRHGPDQVGLAMGRMRNLFPWCQDHRPPFSAYDVEKQFSKALATAAPPPARGVAHRSADPNFDVGQDLRERAQRGRQEEEKERRKQESYRAALDRWRAEARAALMLQPSEVQQRYAREAREFYDRLAFARSRTPEERRRLREEMALKLYGDAHGLPMPVP